MKQSQLYVRASVISWVGCVRCRHQQGLFSPHTKTTHLFLVHLTRDWPVITIYTSTRHPCFPTQLSVFPGIYLNLLSKFCCMCGKQRCGCGSVDTEARPAGLATHPLAYHSRGKHPEKTCLLQGWSLPPDLKVKWALSSSTPRTTNGRPHAWVGTLQRARGRKATIVLSVSSVKFNIFRK